jgi:hypothetical protein
MGHSILLVHIGDIHIKNRENPILQRADEIVCAIRAQRLDISDCVIIVAGDIAFSGLPEEYALAKSFFLTVIPALRQEFNGLEPRILFVPGNHDCDLESASDIRQAGLTPAETARLDPEGGFAREFLAVQKAFWDFTSELGHACITTTERLYSRRVITTSTNASIAFTCINSAWASTNPEVPGTLLYPYTLHRPIEDFTADMEVTISHHPPHWLQPEHGRVLRDSVEKRADLVITGHEHEADAFTTVKMDVNLDYIAGRAMYDKGPEDTGFNLINVDLSNKQWSVLSLIWDGSCYTSTGQWTVHAFLRNRALIEQGFHNNSRFLDDDLTDIGTGFFHEKKQLRIHDVFVYPNLQHRAYQRNLDGKRTSPRRIKYKDVVAFLVSESRVFILGPSRSGKSSLGACPRNTVR